MFGLDCVDGYDTCVCSLDSRKDIGEHRVIR